MVDKEFYCFIQFSTIYFPNSLPVTRLLHCLLIRKGIQNVLSIVKELPLLNRILLIFRSHNPNLVNFIRQVNSNVNRSHLCKPVMDARIYS